MLMIVSREQERVDLSLHHILVLLLEKNWLFFINKLVCILGVFGAILQRKVLACFAFEVFFNGGLYFVGDLKAFSWYISPEQAAGLYLDFRMI